MEERAFDIIREPEKPWGGPWTELKLKAFENYVRAYLRIMSKRKWRTIYFDGFAGSGRLDNRRGAPLFHFVFASNKPTALKIASQIIQKG